MIEIKESTYLFSLAFSERTTTESIIDLFLMPYVTILDIFQRLTNVLILLIAIVDVGVFFFIKKKSEWSINRFQLSINKDFVVALHKIPFSWCYFTLTYPIVRVADGIYYKYAILNLLKLAIFQVLW